MADEKFRRRLPFLFLEDIRSRFEATYGDDIRTMIAFAANKEFSRVLAQQMVRPRPASDPGETSLPWPRAGLRPSPAAAPTRHRTFTTTTQRPTTLAACAPRWTTSRTSWCRTSVRRSVSDGGKQPGPAPAPRASLDSASDRRARAERVLERNERIELLVDKTDALSEQSLMFERQVRTSGCREGSPAPAARGVGKDRTSRRLPARRAVPATAATHVVEKRQDDAADPAPRGRRSLRHRGDRVRGVQLPQLQVVGRTGGFLHPTPARPPSPCKRGQGLTLRHSFPPGAPRSTSWILTGPDAGKRRQLHSLPC